MAREDDIASLLEAAKNTGPIERHIDDLARAPGVPTVAVGMCLLRIEEAAGPLVAVLSRAAEGGLPDEDFDLFFRGLHILAGARCKAAFLPLLKLLALPDRELDRLLGDALTETGGKLVAGVFDGDEQALFRAVCELERDEFARNELLDAVTWLTFKGEISRAATEAFLTRIDDERLFPLHDQAWVGWQQAIALLGMTGLAGRVETAFAEDRFPQNVLHAGHFRRDLAEARQRPRDQSRFTKLNVGFIADVLEELERWAPRAEEPAGENASAPAWDMITDRLRNSPATNYNRDLGRNDPCPCGSGKKWKKCCLSTA